MKKLFNAIRHEDIDIVKELIFKKPELVNCVAKQPPKKDDGQSPLQVALKTGSFEIAEFLIEQGADMNFMEDEASCCNEWRAPVLQDAVIAAVMCSRWNMKKYYEDGYEFHSTLERAEAAYSILEKMISLGADVNAVDSYGKNSLWRFCLQAKQILPGYDYMNDCERDDRLFTEELRSDLCRILILLKDAGVDVDQVSPTLGQKPLEFFSKGSLHNLLAEVFGE